jgi:hypothetical protein
MKTKYSIRHRNVNPSGGKTVGDLRKDGGTNFIKGSLKQGIKPVLNNS